MKKRFLSLLRACLYKLYYWLERRLFLTEGCGLAGFPAGLCGWSPNSVTGICCDECGCISIAWNEDENRWDGDCVYDCCCLNCFCSANDLDPEAGDLFPRRIELDPDGYIKLFNQLYSKPTYISMNNETRPINHNPAALGRACSECGTIPQYRNIQG